MAEPRSFIETGRLRLVPFAPDQLIALIEEPSRFADLAGFPAAPGLREFFVSGDVSPDWLAKLRTLRQPEPWALGFAVIHREAEITIGSAGFKGPPDAAGMIEVAYGIVPSFEGRGYATEVTQALITWARDTGSVEQIRAHTLPTPNASTRVLTKCGFQFVAEVTDPEDGLVWRWERAAETR